MSKKREQRKELLIGKRAQSPLVQGNLMLSRDDCIRDLLNTFISLHLEGINTPHFSAHERYALKVLLNGNHHEVRVAKK